MPTRIMSPSQLAELEYAYKLPVGCPFDPVLWSKFPPAYDTFCDVATLYQLDSFADSVLLSLYEAVMLNVFDRLCTPEEMAARLLEAEGHVEPIDKKKSKKIKPFEVRTPAYTIPGHHFGSGRLGPRPNSGGVVAISKVPGREEQGSGLSFSGPSRELMCEVARSLGYSEINDWYMTNLCHHTLPSSKAKKLDGRHIKDGIAMLVQELAIIKPKILVLMGADVVGAVGGKSTKLGTLRSGLFYLEDLTQLGSPLTSHLEYKQRGIEPPPGAIKVVSTIHPAAILREDGLRASFVADMALAMSVERGADVTSYTLQDRAYTYTHDPVELNRIVDDLISQGLTEFCVDIEGGGSDFKLFKIRTIQFSWAPKTAVVVRLMDDKGNGTTTLADRSALISGLQRLFHRRGVSVFGHNFRYDAKRLEHIGLSVMEHFSDDTLLMDHILNENAEHGLEACATRYTDMGRYDIPLERWKSENKANRAYLTEKGYLYIPDDLLLPYAAQDVDCGFRVFKYLMEQLKKPENLPVYTCYRQVVMPCSHALHEMEMTGLLADRERMIFLVNEYDKKRIELKDNLCKLLGNPNFNPRSNPSVQELLFDTLKLPKYKTTGKPSKMWEDVQDLPPEELARYNPSVDSETLEALSVEDTSGIVSALRDFRLIDQMQKSFLRLPGTDEEGYEEYGEGIVGAVSTVDGRVHTTLSQASETGRQKSSNPNCQNFPAKQDKALADIMGENVPRLRSCFIAPPKHVIIAADYQSAEIFTLGNLANCKQLLIDAQTDLHARGAVNYFNAPRWEGFEEGRKPPDSWKKQYKDLRVGAKTVNFGEKYSSN